MAALPWKVESVASKPFVAMKPANDNAHAGLNIFDWTATRFRGDPEPTQYLVDGVIEAGIPGMIAAMGEVGKSFALLELHRRIAFGSSEFASPIFGGKVVREGTAVFITGEDDKASMHRRLAAIDTKQARHAENADKLILVPMPSVPGGLKPYWRADRQKGFQETDEWRRLCDQLSTIPDLVSVAVDPLQLFAHVPLNEDPAAGQFVCGSIAFLAASTGANVFFAHHMKKSGKEKIANLSQARDAVRGTTALVDGVRLVYGLWYPDEAKGKEEAKKIGAPYQPNAIVHGGVVKANGAAKRILSTYARNSSGLIVDKTTMLGSSAPPQEDLLAALVIAIEGAAAKGMPFTKTGQAGVYENKERLPVDLADVPKHRLVGLIDDALDRGEIVRAAAKGEKSAKWLDVPDGPFARGLGMFSAGAPK